MIDESKFTPRFARIMRLATEHADKRNNDWLGVDHLLLALAQERVGLHQEVLGSFGITPDEFSERVREHT